MIFSLSYFVMTYPLFDHINGSDNKNRKCQHYGSCHRSYDGQVTLRL